ncbi:MAG: ABC transporter permease [Gammaproteobacteria bacterium]|nr:MAG: ABC transporter permease [Gammaproteobacteria bacterium]
MLGQPALLISDYLIWSICLIGGISLAIGLRNPLQRQRWRMILSTPSAMASAIILLTYLAIALLDSVHFRPLLPQDEATTNGSIEANSEQPNSTVTYAASEISLLDLLLSNIRKAEERSYSAPLAIYAFSKESLVTAAGTTRAYPRLLYGGADLENPALHRSDIVNRTLTGLGLSLILVIPIFLLFRRRSRRSPTLSAGNQTPAWRTAFMTIAGLLIIGSVATQLADHYHLLGTEKVGQDVLYLGLKSIRTGVLIGALTLLIMLPLALVLGTAAGYFGGWIDDAVQYLYTTLSSIPGVLLIAAAVLSVNLYLDQNLSEVTSLHQRADLRLLLLTGILGLTGWIGLCRLLRAESLKLRELDYVTAARAFGVVDARILIRHLLPNLGHIVLITIVIDFSGLVLAEAVLSYVGVGVDPSMISWGNMINSARLELAREPLVWWSLATAFIFMFTLVLCANLFADAVRDAFDPRLRGKQ